MLVASAVRLPSSPGALLFPYLVSPVPFQNASQYLDVCWFTPLYGELSCFNCVLPLNSSSKYFSVGLQIGVEMYVRFFGGFLQMLESFVPESKREYSDLCYTCRHGFVPTFKLSGRKFGVFNGYVEIADPSGEDERVINVLQV